MITQRRQSGFVLWEVLLSAYLSVLVILLALRYWGQWSRELACVLARLQVIQKASVLYDVLQSRWGKKACPQTDLGFSVLSAKDYHRQYSAVLILKSSVLLRSACGNHRAYFLAQGRGQRFLSLYEKEEAHAAQAVITGLLRFDCGLAVKGGKNVVLCQCAFPWVSVSATTTEKVFTFRFKGA